MEQGKLSLYKKLAKKWGGKVVQLGMIILLIFIPMQEAVEHKNALLAQQLEIKKLEKKLHPEYTPLINRQMENIRKELSNWQSASLTVLIVIIAGMFIVTGIHTNITIAKWGDVAENERTAQIQINQLYNAIID